MATNKNKYKYGLKNVHYAPVTFDEEGTPSFGTPVAIPGAVNLSLSKNGDTTVFYADDGVYIEIGNNASFDGDLEIALIPESFRVAALGETVDDKGVVETPAEPELGHFALLFEFAADKKAVRHVLYNCTASQNELAGATKGETVEVQTETLSLSAKPLPGGGPVKAKSGDGVDETAYDNWYKTVYQKAAA